MYGQGTKLLCTVAPFMDELQNRVSAYSEISPAFEAADTPVPHKLVGKWATYLQGSPEVGPYLQHRRKLRRHALFGPMPHCV